MGLLLTKEDAQALIDKIGEFQQEIDGLLGQDSQADFTVIQSALADEGIVMPFLQGGIIQQLLTQKGGNFIKVTDAAKRIIAKINRLPVPPPFTPAAPIPA